MEAEEGAGGHDMGQERKDRLALTTLLQKAQALLWPHADIAPLGAEGPRPSGPGTQQTRKGEGMEWPPSTCYS